jgi:hypothetical protein
MDQRRLLFRSALLIMLLLLMGLAELGTTTAQEPIVLNEIKQGQVVAGSSLPTYTFSAAPGEVIEVEILGIGQGFVPQFTVLKADNSSLGVWYTLNQSSSLKGLVQLPDGGQYRLLVNNVGDPQQGLFVITLRPGVLPTVLKKDEPQTGELHSGESIRYVVEANSSQTLNVSVDVLNSTKSVQVELEDAGGNVIATLGSHLNGGAFYIPAGRGRYTVVLSNLAVEASTITYTVAMRALGESGGGNGATTMIVELKGQQITVPVLPTEGDCVIAAALDHADHNHNVRNGPSMSNPVFDKIDPTQFYNVIGVSRNGAWFQIEINGNRGWVTYNHMRLGGNCDAVPVTGG